MFPTGLQSRERYRYTRDLEELSKGRPMRGQGLPKCLTQVNTPLVLVEWQKLLEHHPDHRYREYLLTGLEQGFRIGFRYQSHSSESARTNMKSAIDNPGVVDQYLAKEVGLERVIGPLEAAVLPSATTSSFGVIPKPHQPGKHRLILDLSRPRGSSVNDGIEADLCSLKYTSVDQAVQTIMTLGPGALMAKFDIESAYRLIPVHPDDRPLLGMTWRDKLYIDAALPFGLRSAPKIFNAMADAMQWIFRSQGIALTLHYLDDFIVFGAPATAECQAALDLALQLCHRLGIPIAAHKTEGPARILIFLGIELDTVEMEIRLPKEKLQRLKREIQRWRSRLVCTKRELLSLIGQLQHACCVVKPGRTFLRRMINLASTVRELHFKVRLNKSFRSDLAWWACFLPAWNGTGMMEGVVSASPVGSITSDASGSWGCGAFTSAGEWFQLKLPESWDGIHITTKELLPIVIGAALWGEQWRGKTIRCWCDNAAVVAIIRSGSSREERVMHLMRSLFFILAHYNMQITAQHIPGVENGAADALSRNDAGLFLTQVPSAHREPSAIPSELLQMLVHNRQDWMSQNWTNLWGSSLRRV